MQWSEHYFLSNFASWFYGRSTNVLTVLHSPYQSAQRNSQVRKQSKAKLRLYEERDGEFSGTHRLKI